MPNGFDFDFKEAYGHEFDDMSRREKDMAIMSQLYYLRKDTALVNSKTKPVRRLEILTYAHSAFIAAQVGLLTWIYQNFWVR